MSRQSTLFSARVNNASLLRGILFGWNIGWTKIPQTIYDEQKVTLKASLWEE